MKIPKIMAIIVISILVGVLVAGCGAKTPTTTTTYQDVTVAKGNITNQITSTGTLEYADQENLFFVANGTISEVNVEVGDLFRKDAVLATLDTEERANQMETLGKAVKTAENTLKAAENDIIKKQRVIAGKELAVTDAELNVQSARNSLDDITDVKEAKDAVDAAELNLKVAESNFMASGAAGNTVAVDYYRQLINGTGTPPQGGLKQALANAQKNYQEVSTGINVTSDVELQIEKVKLQIKQAQRTLDEAKIAVEDAKTAVSDAEVTKADAELVVKDAKDAMEEVKATSLEIKAPFDGVVISVGATKGGAAKKGATAMVVADTARFQATMLVNEMDITSVNIGTQATIEPSSMSGTSLSARVTRIAPVATNQSGVVSYKVTAEITSLTDVQTKTSAESTKEAQKRLDDALNSAVTSGRITQAQVDQLRTRLESIVANLSDQQLNQMIQNSGRTQQGGGPGGFSIQGAGGNLTQEQMDQLRQRFQDGGQGFGQQQVVASPANVQLRQGLSLTVNLIKQQKLNVLVVPNSAVKTQGGKSYVQVKNSSGVMEQREVTVGLKDYTNTEIVGGLTESETVVITKTTTTSSTNTPQRQQSFGIGGGIMR